MIANFPAKRIVHWQVLLQARAIENQAFVAGINRIGNDPHTEYCGRSLIVDPTGKVLAETGDREAILKQTLALEELRKYRNGLPFLDDLRVQEVRRILRS